MENEIEIKLNNLLTYFLHNELINEDSFNLEKSNKIVTELNLLDYDEFIELAIILNEDKYINCTISHLGMTPRMNETTKAIDHAKITTKGRLFILSGGYIQLKEQKVSLANRVTKNEATVKKLTCIVAVGTAIAGIYYLIEISKFVYHHLSICK